MFTLSGFNKVRFLETTFPEQLKFVQMLNCLHKCKDIFVQALTLWGVLFHEPSTTEADLALNQAIAVYQILLFLS